jgi:Ni/Co efflux regulator RcnB
MNYSTPCRQPENCLILRENKYSLKPERQVKLRSNPADGVSILFSRGGRNMHRGKKLLASLFMSAALAAPIAVNAVARPQDDRDRERQERAERRVYDREHRDYHNWDDREDSTYRRWLEERHQAYRDFNRLKRREQRDYWNWRHSHEQHEEHEHH